MCQKAKLCELKFSVEIYNVWKIVSYVSVSIKCNIQES